MRGLLSLAAGLGAIFALGMDTAAPLDSGAISKNARKRAAKKAVAAPTVLVETRQLRRARERAEKKGRQA